MAECLRTILDACAGLDARVVVTTGPVVDPAELQAPRNAEVHRYVPHAELMPKASLLIGHGGHSTTMQALAHDLPTVLMPMHPMLDQAMVARTVQAAGAGRVVRKKATAAELAPVIASLLADGPRRAAAARLGAQIRSCQARPTPPTGSNTSSGTKQQRHVAPSREPGDLGTSSAGCAKQRYARLAVRRG